MNDKIDFVITWVDGNDKEWQKEKAKYEKNKQNIDNRDIRYRDLDTLKYWFRGVEKYTPWVNKIHFITCGHLPSWLNVDNPKLHIVKHSDYIPHDALPTFNSNAIELPIYRIEGLSEQFVIFNDDIFIMNKMKKTDFFKKGLPCNTMSLMPIIPYSNSGFYKVVANNIEIINKNFNYKESIKKNVFKYLSFKRGKYVFKTYPLLFYNRFPGFANYHMPHAYLKSTFEEVWNKEEETLNKTVYSRFRDNINNVNHWLFNYWQFAKGTYKQRGYKYGKSIKINNPDIKKVIEQQKYKVLVLHEADEIKDFAKVKNNLVCSFQKILPDKSSFEK